MTPNLSPSIAVPAVENAVVDDILATAATRGERAISVARAVFCLAVFARTCAIGGLDEPGALIGVPAAFAGVGVSAYLWYQGGRRALRRWELVLSVVTDSLVCVISLLPNVLWPWPGYTGLFSIPDGAALVLVAMVGGLRLYPSVTVVAGALHIVSFITLVALDFALSGPQLAHPARNVSIVALLLVGAVVVGGIAGARTLRLARASAVRAVENERAREALKALLQEHHDVRSFLSAATLNSDVILRRLSDAGEGGAGALTTIAADLREDLLQVQRLVTEVKERSFAELARLEGRRPAPLRELVAMVTSTVARRYPSTTLVAEHVADASVLVVGGPAGLERVLLNLLTNACEGDGERRAARVEVSARKRDDCVVLEVRDDGPGFDPRELAGAVAGASRKPDGSGFGLMLTAGILESSGGSLRRENRAEGGARVTLELPLAAGALAATTT